MFCYLVYASSQSRGVEKPQLHKGWSARSFLFLASCPQHMEEWPLYTRHPGTKPNWSPHLQEFWNSEGCVTPSVSQGFKEGHCGLRGPAQFPGRGVCRQETPCACGLFLRAGTFGAVGRPAGSLCSVPVSGQMSPWATKYTDTLRG